MFNLLQPTESSKRRLMDRGARLKVNVLVQQAQLHASRADHVAAIRCLFTSNKAEDRALAGAVSTYKSNVFSGVHLQRSASQDILNAVGLMNF
jgi:hypothetical protein